ncbi:hypothetical protein M0805_004800 [Coniferiporia weirii]|nr:hypothetical protein M0805_004800 [Coniferiporia weirii]
MFDPSTLPHQVGQLLLVTDRLAAPAEFIVLSILASHLRRSQNRKCILVSFSQAFSHWKSIATRLNPSTNLLSHSSDGSFTFLDGFPDLSLSAATLRPLYDRICQALEGCDTTSDDGPNMIILDGLSLLQWSGMPIVEIKRFVRALRAICVKHQTTLVVSQHLTSSDELDELTRSLLHQCMLHLEVLPLASGRSGAISGEIALHRGPLLKDCNIVDAIGRSLAVQYRLGDTGALYFGRGTSAGVL